MQIYSQGIVKSASTNYPISVIYHDQNLFEIGEKNKFSFFLGVFEMALFDKYMLISVFQNCFTVFLRFGISGYTDIYPDIGISRYVMKEVQSFKSSIIKVGIQF